MAWLSSLYRESSCTLANQPHTPRPALHPKPAAAAKQVDNQADQTAGRQKNETPPCPTKFPADRLCARPMGSAMPPPDIWQDVVGAAADAVGAAPAPELDCMPSRVT
jgi:hypothetical protein